MHCIVDGEREEARKETQAWWDDNLQITDSEGEIDTQVVHDVEEWE